jgi:hypothetical protein
VLSAVLSHKTYRAERANENQILVLFAVITRELTKGKWEHLPSSTTKNTNSQISKKEGGNKKGKMDCIQEIKKTNFFIEIQQDYTGSTEVTALPPAFD